MKFLTNTVLLLFAAFLSLPCLAAEADTLVNADRLADLLIEEGMKHKGAHYHYGSRGPKYFDCSGFVGYVYDHYGFTLPRSSWQMASVGEPVEGSISNLQKGDIVLFSGRGISKTVGHVGIYIGPSDKQDDFIFIHAAIKGGVQVSHLTEDYYKKRFLGARRLLPTFFSNPAGSSAAGQPLDIDLDNTVIPVRDTLEIGPGGYRLALLPGGAWLIVSSDGTLVRPDSDTTSQRIVVNPDGTWYTHKLSRVAIPSTSVPAASAASAASASADTSSVADSAATSDKVTANVTSPEADVQYHKVQKGDTLYSIARRYGTTVNKLCALNGISAKSVLKIGKRLRVK